jgi:hypothetical protein
MESIRRFFRGIQIFKFKFPRTSLSISGGVFLVVFVIFLWRVRSLSFPVVLRFNEAQGILKFGEQGEIFGVWFSFLALSILNVLLGEYFFLRDRFLAYTLFVMNIFLAVFFLAVALLILFIN